ncbi:hypothetical protein [Methylobacterium sp. sgz302541]|uniref:hypothetical protein n=1 Tax=unclassified Methylobacterium TaxID=2615210 RepID=UPI003D3388F3
MGNAPAWRDEFAAAGYKPFTDSLLAHREEHTPADRRMYVGSMQKRVTDRRGTRYFVNVALWDLTMHEGGRRSASASVHFQMLDDNWDGAAEVRRSVEGSVAETEEWYADLWQRMGWAYYEVDRDEEPAGNVVLPAPLEQGNGE